MKNFWLAVVYVALANEAAWAAKEPLVLKTNSKWTVNYANDSCRLFRQFGDDAHSAFLVIDRFGPGDGFNLILAGKPFEYKGSQEELSVQFGPNEPEQKVKFFTGDFGKGVPALIQRGDIGLGPYAQPDLDKFEKANKMGQRYDLSIGPEREAAVTYVLVGKPLKQQVRLETGPMQKPLAALNTCVNNLLISWGVDVAKFATRTKDPVPNGSYQNWIRSSDYPAKMLAEFQSAIIHARLNINETGTVSGCYIQQTTRAKKFDDAVCKSMTRRATFQPALDADGKPMASFWRQSIVFVIGQ